MTPLKWDNSNWLWSRLLPAKSCLRYICDAAFSLLGNRRMFIRDKRWKIKSGRETEERVCIACGDHYFWPAPRLGELENIILSGWFDSAMKNVRSGDDKSWCWGERTGRQGMSFVMSAIWLHPTSSLSPPPSHLPSLPHLTPLSPLFTPQLPTILPPPMSACLSLPFSFHCNDLFEHILLPLIFLHPAARAPVLCLSLPNIALLSQLLTLTALQSSSFVKCCTYSSLSAQERKKKSFDLFTISFHNFILAPPTFFVSPYSSSSSEKSLVFENGKD